MSPAEGQTGAVSRGQLGRRDAAAEDVVNSFCLGPPTLSLTVDIHSLALKLASIYQEVSPTFSISISFL
jgi:hypothetical protein